MIKFLADENFNGKIVRGLLRRNPNLSIIRVQDSEVAEADDPTILEWAAREGRVLLTHDANTVTKFAYKRIEAGQPMPGVFEVKQSLAIGRAIEDIFAVSRSQS